MDVYEEVTKIVVDWCRECWQKQGNVVADFIIWGTMMPKESLGPRCMLCASKYFPIQEVDQWAVLDLRPLRKAIGISRASVLELLV